MNPSRAVVNRFAVTDASDSPQRIRQNRSCRAAALLAALLLGSAAFAPRLCAQDKLLATPPVTNSQVVRPHILIPHVEGEEREGVDFLQRRQHWFFHPRTYPLGFIPAGARQRALEHVRRMQQQQSLALGAPVPGAQLQAAQPQSAAAAGGAQLAAPGSGAGGGFVVPSSGTGAAWLAIGPQATSSSFYAPYTSGRVTALAVDPCDATGNTVFLGGADGGVWKTTNGGVAWTPLFDYQPLTSVGSIAIDPTPNTNCAASIVYVGTGEDNFGGDNIYGAGVFKSTNGGATWTRDNTFKTPSPLDDARMGPSIGAIAVNRAPGKNNILLAAVRGRGTALQSGIWCSADSGVNWTWIWPTVPRVVGTDVAFASDGTAYVALGTPSGDATNNGIYKSSVPVTSCTITWNKQTLPAGTPASSLGRIALAIAPSDNNTVYAAIADSTTGSNKLLGVIKTSNAGSSWAQLTDALVNPTKGFCNDQCFYDLTIAVHPTDPLTVFAGGAANNATVIRSMDGGSTWAEVSRNNVAGATDALHVDTHAFAFNTIGSILYVGNDGGVWSTNNPKGTVGAGYWSNLNAPLNITQFYPGISIHPSTPKFGLGGTQDNGVQVYTGSMVWTDTGLSCDGGFTAIDPQTPTTTYGECEYLPNPNGILQINISYTGDGMLGNGFVGITGIDPTDRGSFIPPLVLDKNNPLTLYFGTCRVWQTTDGANTWNAISADVTTSAHTAGCGGTTGGNLTAITVAPSASATIYTGADNGEIEATVNSGTVWTSLTTTTLPVRSITQVAVDPANSKKAYVTFSGFGTCANVAITCDGKGHVFMTTDATVVPPVWTDISGTGASALPDIPVNDIVIDPDDPTHSTLYVATDVGAFFTTTATTPLPVGGPTWSILGASSTLPNSEILSLVLHDPSRTLRAATHGRGVWDLNLGPAAGTPTFAISSISPIKALQGAADITNFTVNGVGFTASSTINFAINGTTHVLTPTSINIASSPNVLVATLPATPELAAGGVAQVSVSNPGPVNTASVPFVVLAPDFVIATSTVISKTVKAGVSAQYPISIVALNGFTAAVSLSCSLPAAAKGTTCTVSPNSVSPGGSATVTVTTTAFLPPAGFRQPSRPANPMLPVVPAALLAAVLLALLAYQTKRPRPRLGLTAAFAALAFFVILPLAGCGGGSSSAPPPVTNSTPKGTYTITVTGTSGSITHTTPLTIVVN
ncbi:MAG: glycoside hydrolase [Acidobacteriia bacterium]|nr:glycoside hydrolase [Terriglobia bacterium]